MKWLRDSIRPQYISGKQGPLGHTMWLGWAGLYPHQHKEREFISINMKIHPNWFFTPDGRDKWHFANRTNIISRKIFIQLIIIIRNTLCYVTQWHDDRTYKEGNWCWHFSVCCQSLLPPVGFGHVRWDCKIIFIDL